ncbi:hypothetical protein MMC26_000222, partial [Xylographa opegraphella]|nr:hypothetical protein [Xylographa opegraphella]
MDPLAFTASLIAVIGLVGKTVTAIAKIRAMLQSKDELSALINEITDLQAILTTIAHISQEEDHNDQHLGPKKALASHVQRAKDKILELQELIAYRLLGADGSVKAVRLAWLREKHVVLRLQSELKSIRWNLATSLGMVTS